MINRIFAFFSAVVIAFLLFVSLFPNTVCSKSLMQKSLGYLPPNNGHNELFLYNDAGDYSIFSGEPSVAVVDSIVVWARSSDKKWSRTIADRFTLEPGEMKKISFQIDRISLESVRSAELRIFSDSWSLFFTLNTDDDTKRIRASRSYQLRSPSIPTRKNALMVRSILGTDKDGSSIWSRLVYGTRIVISIVFISSIVSVFVGVLTGVIRGYFRGFGAHLITVLSNFFSSISLYIAAILLYIFIKDRTVITLIVTFSLIQWAEIQKVVSHKVGNIRNEDFIAASRMFGKSDWAIIREDILPLLIPEILIGFFFLAKRIIVIEASLSFLLISVEPPNVTWGKLFADVRPFCYNPEALQFILPPIFAIVVTSLSFNILEIYFKSVFRRKRC